ncbi:MAG: MFS transporter [Candidatus Eiseniibacteriota bacterium]
MHSPSEPPARGLSRLASRIPRPDWLSHSRGRMAAFFLLYMSEGIPYGFSTIAIATQMRRHGVGPAEIGLFVGVLYLPWGLKFLAGPFVDTFGSLRFGRYRLWIVLMQLGLAASLLLAVPIDFATGMGLFTTVLLVHNMFGAVQDVAIDALAVNVLKDNERGAANGYMWAGYAAGQALGGAGVLYLSQIMPFRMTFVFVAAVLLLLLVTVSLPLREPKREDRPAPGVNPFVKAGRDIVDFVRDSGRAFVSSRGALVGVAFALLPTGAYALGLALYSNLAVELGMSDTDIANLGVASQMVSIFACIGGGTISDRVGRRRTLALSMIGLSIPTLALAWTLQQAGLIHAIGAGAVPGGPGAAVVPAAVVTTFWGLVILYQFFNGVMYSVSIALYMDVTTPRVAATQFTAYMAIANLCTSYSAVWQGQSIARFGYPATLVIDGLIGLVAISLLPFMTRTPLRKRLATPTAAAPAAIPESIP